MVPRSSSGATRSWSSWLSAPIAATGDCSSPEPSAFPVCRLWVGAVQSSTLAAAILDAIDEPALIVRRGTVEAANQAAQSLLGQQIIGRDLRFAIRHPLA